MQTTDLSQSNSPISGKCDVTGRHYIEALYQYRILRAYYNEEGKKEEYEIISLTTGRSYRFKNTDEQESKTIKEIAPHNKL